MPPKKSLLWLPLDNAAKIYPAARRKNWSNVFRLSADLYEPIDEALMQKALDVTVLRFPSIAVRLRRGMFWYYLQQLPQAPQIETDYSYPLTHMDKTRLRQCALRVLVYRNRVAVEFFHSLTDGNGGLVFLKTLLAEYLQQKYGILIPAQLGVLDRQEQPDPEELEDSFLKYAGSISAGRKERTAWQPSGTPETNGFLHVTCFQLPAEKVLDAAHKHGVSLTAFLTAAVMDALQRLQQQSSTRPKPIKVLIPVNLRKLFPSRSLRNFALYTIPELLPQLGHYTFPEICKLVHHHMGSHITPKQMSMMIETNVADERGTPVRLLPLFVKNLVMKSVFNTVGERKSCLTLSNLGAVTVPDEMSSYIKRMDFILGVQANAPYNCGVLSWNNTLYINFIRNIREPLLEQQFYAVLQEQGLPVTVQSN